MTPEITERSKAALDRLHDIPTLPDIYQKLTRVLADQYASVWDIEQVIRQDPVVTTKLLRLANSSLFCLATPVSAVTEAIRTVGYDALKQLLLTTSVVDLFPQIETLPFSLKAYWEHCLGTAVAARQIAWWKGEEHLEEFFVGGLLHDIGKLVHAVIYPDRFHAALTLARRERLTLETAEYTMFGFSHAQTGGLLGYHWGLAPDTQRAIAYHHAPVPHDHQATTVHEHIIHCADLISISLGLGQSGSYAFPPFVPFAWDMLQLSSAHLAKIVAATTQETRDLLQIVFEDHTH
jgi:putative nucleotidyltransferase with HDIG domain